MSYLTIDGGPLTAEHVRTAQNHLTDHVPVDADAERPVCASAVHKVAAPTWPCRDRYWAEHVLAARDRGEVPGAA